ncbi:MAG: LLM class flavin-dependent oxidoreductase [Acetobacteraceae bacterium]|nr:LLM class flavin-dependent oxidoreductase [Acetobacteraceae bacterium]
MTLPLDTRLWLGVQTIHRRTEPASAPWEPRINELVSLVELVDRSGYDSLWTGDHVSFAVPMLDPLLQLAQAGVVSRRLLLGTAVYLLPLRHPAPVAKQVATLDHLTEGRLIFGVGVGGEFPQEYAVCGVPMAERGARLGEGVRLLREFWTGSPVTHTGRFYGGFQDVALQPPSRQPGGPPVWFGGRSKPALRRAGRLGDGYLSYVVTPEMFADALATIEQAASEAGRDLRSFGTGHLLFTRLDASFEAALDAAAAALSVRYAMDFRRPAQRYCALGSPAQVAERVRAFHAAGARHVVLDFVGPYEERDQQIARFAGEVMPMLVDLTTVGAA